MPQPQKKQSQRTKGNVRPSSSSQAAALLHTSGASPSGGFVGFGAVSTPAFVAAGESLEDDCTSGLDPTFRMTLRKLSKKDPTTKIKTLQELRALCENQDVEVVKSVLPYWPRIYNRLSMDDDHKVREATQVAMATLATRVGRDLAPHLKSIMGYWLMAQYDSYPTVATAARAGFTAAFPSHKQIGVLMFCSVEISHLLLDNLLNQSPLTLTELRPASSEEIQARYCRLLSSSLLAWRRLLGATQADASRVTEFLESGKLAKIAKINNSIVRAALFSLLASVCQHDLVTASSSKNIVALVLSYMDDSDAVIAPALWEAILSVVNHIPEWHQLVNIQKSFIPKLKALLRNGCYGNAAIVAPNLFPLVGHIPADIQGGLLEFYTMFMENLQLGLFETTIQSETSALVIAYMECLTYLLNKQATQKEFCHTLLNVQLVSIIQTSLVEKSSNLSKSPLYSMLPGNDQSDESLQTEICVFYENLTQILHEPIDTVNLDDSEFISERIVNLITNLISPDKNRHITRERVRFSLDDTPKSPPSTNENDLSNVEVSDKMSTILADVYKHAFNLAWSNSERKNRHLVLFKSLIILFRNESIIDEILSLDVLQTQINTNKDADIFGEDAQTQVNKNKDAETILSLDVLQTQINTSNPEEVLSSTVSQTKSTDDTNLTLHVSDTPTQKQINIISTPNQSQTELKTQTDMILTATIPETQTPKVERFIESVCLPWLSDIQQRPESLDDTKCLLDVIFVLLKDCPTERSFHVLNKIAHATPNIEDVINKCMEWRPTNDVIIDWLRGEIIAHSLVELSAHCCRLLLVNQSCDQKWRTITECLSATHLGEPLLPPATVNKILSEIQNCVDGLQINQSEERIDLAVGFVTSVMDKFLTGIQGSALSLGAENLLTTLFAISLDETITLSDKSRRDIQISWVTGLSLLSCDTTTDQSQFINSCVSLVRGAAMAVGTKVRLDTITSTTTTFLGALQTCLPSDSSNATLSGVMSYLWCPVTDYTISPEVKEVIHRTTPLLSQTTNDSENTTAMSNLVYMCLYNTTLVKHREKYADNGECKNETESKMTDAGKNETESEMLDENKTETESEMLDESKTESEMQDEGKTETESKMFNENDQNDERDTHEHETCDKNAALPISAVSKDNYNNVASKDYCSNMKFTEIKDVKLNKSTDIRTEEECAVNVNKDSDTVLEKSNTSVKNDESDLTLAQSLNEMTVIETSKSIPTFVETSPSISKVTDDLNAKSKVKGSGQDQQLNWQANERLADLLCGFAIVKAWTDADVKLSVQFKAELATFRDDIVQLVQTLTPSDLSAITDLLVHRLEMTEARIHTLQVTVPYLDVTNQSTLLEQLVDQIVSVEHIDTQKGHHSFSGYLAILSSILQDGCLRADLHTRVLDHMIELRGTAQGLWLFNVNLQGTPESLVRVNSEIVTYLAGIVSHTPTDLVLCDTQWDFILCSAVAWLQSIEESSTHLPASPPTQHLCTQASYLLAEIDACIKERLPKHPDMFPRSLETEWKDFFSCASFDILLPLFVKLAENPHASLPYTHLLSNLTTTLHNCTKPLILAAPVQAYLNPEVAMTLPEKHQTLLNRLCPLLESTDVCVQGAAYMLLDRIIEDFPIYDATDHKNGMDVENMEDFRTPPQPIITTLTNTSTKLDRILEQADIDDKPQIPLFSHEFHMAIGNLFAWKLLLSYFNASSTEMRGLYAAYLRSHSTINGLTHVLQLIPESASTLAMFERVESTLSTTGVKTREDLTMLAVSTYKQAVQVCPALVRQWWRDLDRTSSAYVERFTSCFVSPWFCQSQIDLVNSSTLNLDNLTVKARAATREVTATYALEGVSMEMVITLPSNYPLGQMGVSTEKRVGVKAAQWQKWLLQLSIFLQHQNGSIMEGLRLWKRAVDKCFDGVEDCMVCFSVIHPTTCELPKLECRTCHKKFHAACLYKWFKTSHNPTCPLCRNLF